MAAYMLLLAATACLGAGFGLTVPSLNTLAAAFHPAAVCETMNGNWSQLYVTSLGVRTATASLALTGFWAAVTAGRVLLAAIQPWLPSRAAYHGLPFLLAGAFVLIAVLPRNAPAADVAAFCLAGFGCSALLPLTISFGQEKLAGSGAVVAGGVIACYQAGYGIAAFGVGPLVSAGVRLPAIFAASAVVAAAMGALSLVVARGRPSPATVHPRPAQPRPRLSPAAGTGRAPA